MPASIQKNCLLLWALILCSLQLNAQSNRLSGTIIDAETKEPIPYASVYLKKSGYGSITDSAGNFHFLIPENTADTLNVSYIGYELFNLPIHLPLTENNLSIQLKRQGLKNEVVIKAKTISRGLYLWRKIMSKKDFYNRYKLDNFGYEAYNKLEIDLKNFNVDKTKKFFLLKPYSFIFDNIDSTSEEAPFLPAYLLETISDYAYQRNPKKFFEQIKASNTKGFKNESISKFIGVTDQNVNISSNFINVMDKDFISPFNDNADKFYNFWVPDTQVVNGKKIFHFVFKPKHPGINAFEGDAWVTSQTFQIKKISLFLGKDANVNFVDRLSIIQEFIPLKDSIYFLSKDKFMADFKIMGKKNIAIIGRKNTSYKNIYTNSDSISQRLAAQSDQQIITVNKDATDLSDATWGNIRHDSLSVNEKNIYATTDKLLQDPRFQQLQRRIRFLATGYSNVGNLEIGPWYNWISSNAWEGPRVRFDLGTNKGFNKNIYLHSYLAYGTTDKKLKGLAEAYWILNRAPHRLRLHASFLKDIDNGISHLGEVSQDNIFTIAIRKPNTNNKFLELQDKRFEIYRELGKGFSGELFFVHQIYDPLLNLPFITSAKQEPLRNFEVAFKLRFAYIEKYFEGDFFRYSLGSQYPIVELMYSKGFPGVLKSNYSYDKLYFSVKDFIKISPLGSISYKAYAGKIYGTVPFTILENHPGNNIYYYSANSFNLMTRFEYLSDRYAGINIEHIIGSGIFKFIPLTRKLKWRQFWNVKSVWGNLGEANNELNNDKNQFKTLRNKPYVEVGTGIDNILKVIRLDFIWKLSPADNSINASNFGIFGSFHFQF